jgi:hypothetical protein
MPIIEVMSDSLTQFWASFVQHAGCAGNAAGNGIEHGCRFLTTNPLALVGAIFAFTLLFVRAMKR